MEQEIVLNSHNKQEDPRMHSAEHLLNGTMVKMIGCKRSRNTHIERKKSKCDYPLSEPLTQGQLQEIETTINNVIAQDLKVTYESISAKEAEKLYDLDKLPEDASVKVLGCIKCEAPVAEEISEKTLVEDKPAKLPKPRTTHTMSKKQSKK
jgi:alanyl-tRNA synthetase